MTPSDTHAYRRTVYCCNVDCNESFSYVIRATPQQLAQPVVQVNLSCPFCKTKLVIDLSPWLRRTITSYKGIENDTESNELILELPAELHSQLADKDEDNKPDKLNKP